MFIKLTTTENKVKYYNTEHVKSFCKSEHKPQENYTVLFLTYGTDIVLESPEEIYKMINKE